jgi:hypothetical protein
MTISHYNIKGHNALRRVLRGQRMARVFWNKLVEPERLGHAATHTFVYLVPGSTFEVNRKPLLGILPEGTVVNYLPHIDQRIESGAYRVWTPTQEDLMADDWYMVKEFGDAVFEEVKSTILPLPRGMEDAPRAFDYNIDEPTSSNLMQHSMTYSLEGLVGMQKRGIGMRFISSAAVYGYNSYLPLSAMQQPTRAQAREEFPGAEFFLHRGQVRRVITSKTLLSSENAIAYMGRNELFSEFTLVLKPSGMTVKATLVNGMVFDDNMHLVLPEVCPHDDKTYVRLGRALHPDDFMVNLDPPTPEELKDW